MEARGAGAVCLLCLMNCVDLDSAKDFSSELRRVMRYAEAGTRAAPHAPGSLPAPSNLSAVAHFEGDAFGELDRWTPAFGVAGREAPGDVVLWFGPEVPARVVLRTASVLRAGGHRPYGALRLRAYRGPRAPELVKLSDPAERAARIARAIDDAIIFCPDLTALFEALAHVELSQKPRLLADGYLEVLRDGWCWIDQDALQSAVGALAPQAPATWFLLSDELRASGNETWGHLALRAAVGAWGR